MLFGAIVGEGIRCCWGVRRWRYGINQSLAAAVSVTSNSSPWEIQIVGRPGQGTFDFSASLHEPMGASSAVLAACLSERSGGFGATTMSSIAARPSQSLSLRARHARHPLSPEGAGLVASCPAVSPPVVHRWTSPSPMKFARSPRGWRKAYRSSPFTYGCHEKTQYACQRSLSVCLQRAIALKPQGKQVQLSPSPSLSRAACPQPFSLTARGAPSSGGSKRIWAAMEGSPDSPL
jgi:hypothetical protein